MLGWPNEFYSGLGKLLTGMLIVSATYGVATQSCNKEKEQKPQIDISMNYGTNDKYTVRVFTEFNDTAISIENNYILGFLKPALVARGLTSTQYNTEINGFNIQQDDMLKSYIDREKLIHLRDSILEQYR